MAVTNHFPTTALPNNDNDPLTIQIPETEEPTAEQPMIESTIATTTNTSFVNFLSTFDTEEETAGKDCDFYAIYLVLFTHFFFLLIKR